MRRLRLWACCVLPMNRPFHGKDPDIRKNSILPGTRFPFFPAFLLAFDPMLHVVLIEPEIPPNTGNIARLCLAAGARLHLVGPLGFSLDEKSLRRAGMDYWDRCDVRQWGSFAELRASDAKARYFFFTTKSRHLYWDERFSDGDHLVFGRETRGLPESLLEENAGWCRTIPMDAGARSLNLATAAGIVLYEARRQIRAALTGAGSAR